MAEGTGDLPSIPDFEDRYCGEWESFRAYAEELAHGTGLLSGLPDDDSRYFDWPGWTRDLAFDYMVEDALGAACSLFATCDWKEFCR